MEDLLAHLLRQDVLHLDVAAELPEGHRHPGPNEVVNLSGPIRNGSSLSDTK